MRSTYNETDVTLLLKDITGLLPPLDTREREKKMQMGVHYSEMLPLEYKPSKAYLALYHESLEAHGRQTANAVGLVSEKIRGKRPQPVLVSLARAGTPIGILIKRYLEKKYGIAVPHYAISIIRGRGLDSNAMRYILARHPAAALQFVDGWIGKGAIAGELARCVRDYPGLSGEPAVLADPTGLTTLCGTREDFLIPNSCLNATVSGLFSRTILNQEVIGPADFHGAVYFSHLLEEDLSNHFLDTVEALFPASPVAAPDMGGGGALAQVARIQEEFAVKDKNFIKPGIGETTRVLLRRVPWKILLRDPEDEANIGHIKKLCEEKGVPYIQYPLVGYRACGIIRQGVSGDV